MRFDPRLEEHRVRDGDYASEPGDPFGAFHMPGPCGTVLVMLACNGDVTDPATAGWEHVSVSTRKRTPNWQEMCFAKKLFWAPEECVVQFHPPQSQYVNNMTNCLHLWRHRTEAFPMPPQILV